MAVGNDKGLVELHHLIDFKHGTDAVGALVLIELKHIIMKSAVLKIGIGSKHDRISGVFLTIRIINY